MQTGASSMFAGLQHASRTIIRLELLFTIAVQIALVVLLDLTLAGWAICYAAFALNWSSLQYTDHAFSKLDVRDGAWNLRVNPLTRLLFLNYHHHLAHHRHPHVPWIHLGGYVDPDGERPSFWSVYWSMWRGPRPLPGTTTLPAAAPRSLLPDANTLPFCILFAAVFAVCYGGTAWWTGHYASLLPAWGFAFEQRVPFVPALSLVYLTITPALMLAPFLLRTRAQLAPLAITLCAETLIACVFFLLFPQSTAFVRPEVTGWARVPFSIADTLNMEYNAVPVAARRLRRLRGVGLSPLYVESLGRRRGGVDVADVGAPPRGYPRRRCTGRHRHDRGLSAFAAAWRRAPVPLAVHALLAQAHPLLRHLPGHLSALAPALAPLPRRTHRLLCRAVDR